MAGMIGSQTKQQQRPPLDFPGFAQEFLRRNPAYICDYDSVMTGARCDDPAAREVMARRWGLCFPLPADPLGSRKPGAMGGGGLRLYQHPRRGAAGMPGG